MSATASQLLKRTAGSLQTNRTARVAQTVYAGLSGGVDSSVAAALLKRRGYRVTGVFMKNWTRDILGFPCSWREDYQDAKRVAVQLGIDFKVYDFQRQYRRQVVDYMLAEYQAGRTPNPDVMCNQTVKFELFLNAALADGADLIATGHYARAKNGRLYMAKDKTKDQTYFLYRVTEAALAKTLFPLGDIASKADVRALARRLGLVTADKKDSQGICFVGEVGIREFLLQELGPQAPGKIFDQKGRLVGEHSGAIFYTIGQRHGLNVGGGLPYYVTGKDMKKNEVYVTTNLDDPKLWSDRLELTDAHWINAPPNRQGAGKTYQVRTRHGAPLVECSIANGGGASGLELALAEKVRAVTPGQSVVIYDGERVLGGGIIA